MLTVVLVCTLLFNRLVTTYPVSWFMSPARVRAAGFGGGGAAYACSMHVWVCCTALDMCEHDR